MTNTETEKIVPRCTYFGSCGGCATQHIAYQQQLESKKKKLFDNIKFEDIQVVSDKEYNYRNRMDFIFHRGGLGLRKKGEWQTIIDIEHCEISDNQLNHLLKEIRNFFKNIDFFDNKRKTGTFKYAVIRTPRNTSAISFVLNEDSTKTGDAIEKIKAFAKISTAEHIVVTYVGKDKDISISEEFFVVKGKDMLEEQYLGKTFDYSIQGFFQNNSVMADKMQSYVHHLLQKYPTKDAHLLDLYCGVGTFGIINAALFKDVIMIEGDKNCIDAAEKNIKKNKCKNVKALFLDAMKLKNVTLEKPLYIITDPPRSGMHPKTIEQLNRLQPEVMIYISCNIDQLGKDLLKFKNYDIKSAAMFDLFPQTPHVEAVIELVKKKEIIDSE